MQTATSLRLIGLWFLLASSAANAALIEFIYTGSGSGTLDNTGFSQLDFTIIQVLDTDNIESCGSSCIFNNAISTSISIDGLGSFDFISQTRTFATSGILGFSRGGLLGNDLFGFFSISNYDLSSEVATIFQSVRTLQWTNNPLLETTGGILIFDSGLTDGSFTAKFSSVNAPTSLGILFGVLIFLALQKRRAK